MQSGFSPRTFQERERVFDDIDDVFVGGSINYIGRLDPVLLLVVGAHADEQLEVGFAQYYIQIGQEG